MNPGTLKVRTRYPVVNADPFSKDDFHIVAELVSFDIVHCKYHVIYYKEIPKEKTVDDNVSQLAQNYKYVETYEFPVLELDINTINYLLGYVLKADINKNGTYIQNLQVAMHQAFRIKLGADGRYGVPAQDWELLDPLNIVI